MLTVRPMTEPEFVAWRREGIDEYAAMQVANGVWSPADAVDRATRETDRALAQGRHTSGAILLVGFDGDTEVGTMWISLTSPRQSPGAAFLYDIKVKDELQGRGYGRQLLAAAEDTARSHGRTQLVLSVHGSNTRAIRLYETSGYTVITQQMGKPLNAPLPGSGAVRSG